MLTDLSFSNPNSNAAAAMLCATFAPVRMKYILALQLRHFQKKSVEFIGPFTHFTRNVLFFFYSAHEFPDSEELFNRTESTPRKHAISDVRRVRLERALRFINEVWSKVERTPRTTITPKIVFDNLLAREVDHALSDMIKGLRTKKLLDASRVWRSVSTDRSAQDVLTEVLVRCLDFSPHALWAEALRSRFLPELGQRYSLSRKDLMATLPRGSTDEASIWVMIDVWYYLMGGYTRQEDPPIAELVQHWESTDDSVLRFVVVLRSLLLADETALEPLTTFLEQPTPELKELLELAMQDYDGADPMRDRTN